MVRNQFLPEPLEPCRQPFGLDGLKRNSVNSRSAVVLLGQPIGFAQRLQLADMHVQSPKPPGRFGLRLAVYPPPQSYYGPFRRPLLFGRFPGFAGYTDYLLRRFHDGRRRASPVAQRVLATGPPLPPRRSRVSLFASLRPSRLPSPWGEGFGLRDFHFSGLPVRSLTLRPGDSQSSF